MTAAPTLTIHLPFRGSARTRPVGLRGRRRLGRIARIVALGAFLIMMGFTAIVPATTNAATAYPASNTASVTCSAGGYEMKLLRSGTYISQVAVKVDGVDGPRSLYYWIKSPTVSWWDAQVRRWNAFYPTTSDFVALRQNISGVHKIDAWEYKSLDGGTTYKWYTVGSCSTQNDFGYFPIEFR